MKQNAEQRAFAQAHLESFKEKYFFPSQLNLLSFDEELGNFIARDDLKPEFEQDAQDAYHQVNTGWAMYKKGITTGQNQWISVEDRLPKTEPNTDGVACAVVDTLGNVCRARYMHDVEGDIDHKYWSEFTVNSRGIENENYEIGEKITHWMPLPQPPKGVEQ